MEWLRKETLHTTGARYSQFIFFTQFIHTQDRNDILQLFIALKNEFHSVGCIVMRLSYNRRRKDS